MFLDVCTKRAVRRSTQGLAGPEGDNNHSIFCSGWIQGRQSAEPAQSLVCNIKTDVVQSSNGMRTAQYTGSDCNCWLTSSRSAWIQALQRDKRRIQNQPLAPKRTSHTNHPSFSLSLTLSLPLCVCISVIPFITIKYGGVSIRVNLNTA